MVRVHGREERLLHSFRRRIAEVIARWFVRAALFLSKLICAEPWYQQPRRARSGVRKNPAWAISIRDFFS
jgi:hypothetical protein